MASQESGVNKRFELYMRKLEEEGISKENLDYILCMNNDYEAPDTFPEGLVKLRDHIHGIGNLFTKRRKNWKGHFPSFAVNILLQFLLRIVNTEIKTMQKEDEFQMRWRAMQMQEEMYVSKQLEQQNRNNYQEENEEYQEEDVHKSSEEEEEEEEELGSPDAEELEMLAHVSNIRNLRKRQLLASRARHDIEKIRTADFIPRIKKEDIPDEGLRMVQFAQIIFLRKRDREELDKEHERMLTIKEKIPLKEIEKQVTVEDEVPSPKTKAKKKKKSPTKESEESIEIVIEEEVEKPKKKTKSDKIEKAKK